MQIFIKGISRQEDCNTTTLNLIKTTDSVRTLYLIISNMFNIDPRDYYLHYNKILDVDSDKILQDYDISKESTINLHFRL
tara:strand:- start:227 stop:466 length:240 start_codon:yes stop_codon:yes gene_type:complete